MANRIDLIFEVDTSLDSSGALIGDWFETADIDTLRVTYFFSYSAPNITIDHSMDGSTILATSAPNSFSEVPMAARYARISVSGGTANSPFRACGRRVR